MIYFKHLTAIPESFMYPDYFVLVLVLDFEANPCFLTCSSPQLVLRVVSFAIVFQLESLFFIAFLLGTVYMLTDSIFISWCVEGIKCLILDLETRSKSLAYPFLIMRTMIWLIRWMNKNLCPAEALHSLPLLILNPFIVLDHCLGMFAQFSNLNCCLGWLVFLSFPY